MTPSTLFRPATDLQHVVLGAGPAGTAVAKQLAEAGAPVRQVRRSPQAADPRIESVAADLSDPEAALAATAGADVLYHCVNVPYHLQVPQMPGIARAILRAASAHGARLVVLDTLYPYGTAEGEHITEQTPWEATSGKGRLRADLDRLYLEAHERGEARVALGRAADFFGPGVLNSTLGGAFFPAALTGEQAIAFGDITLPHSYSFIEDVARGLITLGADDRGPGRIWHLPTVPAVSTQRIHELVEDILGSPVDVRVLEEARAVGPFDERFMAEYEEMFYQHRIPQNMVSGAFEQTFGVQPTPLRGALEQTIAWYRRQLA
jgi:nucleoside-diphosphate-sugar epimerase